MTALASPSPVSRLPRRFTNAAEWHHALGNVPLERMIFDPVPGNIAVADLFRNVPR
jgi:hypothetical protein